MSQPPPTAPPTLNSPQRQPSNADAGLFIVFEGLDGAGTTTQSNRLHAELIRRDIPASLSCEPSAGPVGVLLRQGLTGRVNFDERTMALLFAADRLDHLHNQTNGVLKRRSTGLVEVSDRYLWSSLAYQGVSLPPEWVTTINHYALEPDLLFFLDVDVGEAVRRISRRQSETERYDNLQHLTAVRQRYLQLVRQARAEARNNVVVLDSSLPQETVAAQVWENVQARLQQHNLFARANS